MTGLGMMIQLRRKAPTVLSDGSSFRRRDRRLQRRDGDALERRPHRRQQRHAQRHLAWLLQARRQGEDPLDLRCDASMVVTLPRPRATVEVGPPVQRPPDPDPTFAKFFVNVRVRRGTTTIDQLNADTLDLTLMPDRKPIPLTDAQILAQTTEECHRRTKHPPRPAPAP